MRGSEEDEVGLRAGVRLNLDLKKWVGFEWVKTRMLHIRLYRHEQRYRGWNTCCICLRKLEDKPDQD